MKGGRFLKKRKQRLLKRSFLLVILLVFGSMTERYVLAKAGGNDTIQFAYTKSVYASIDIDGNGNVNVNGRIVGDLKVQKIVMNISLQKFFSNTNTWERVKSWSVTENRTKVNLIQNHKVSSKGKYRVKVTGTVYTSKTSEDVSAISPVKSY